MSDRARTAATSCSTMISDSCCSAWSTIWRKTDEEVLRRLDVEARQGLVEEEHARVAGQGPADLDQAADAEGQGGHGRLGHPGQPQQLEQPVDPLVLVLAGREERARIEHVAPEPLRARPGPVGQHEVLAHGEPHEQLGLLEGAGEPLRGPGTGATRW